MSKRDTVQDGKSGSKSVSLTELAEVAGVSLYHFAKAFKQSTGVLEIVGGQ